MLSKVSNNTGTSDFEAAEYAAGILSRHDFAAYIIGGAVRDLWLGRQPKDFDLVTNATPDDIQAMPEFTRVKHTDAAQAFGVTRVEFEFSGVGHWLEIATFRKDLEAHRGRKATKIVFAELEDDVWRRDFTINALALDPSTGQVTDYVGGIEDLEGRLVRFIGQPAARIREDPLRIMRAIRFKNHLGFNYDPVTAEAIKQAVGEGYIERIAVDRIRDELTSLLVHPSRRQALTDLDQFGILDNVLPEVTAGKGVSQPPQFHAEGDVWQHQLLIMEYLPAHISRRLAWAALLHDIGKPATASVPRSADDRIRFNRHYAVGAETAAAILRRLRFSNRDTKDIVWIIYHHMNIDDLPEMRPGHQKQMLGHPAFSDLLELHKADAAASWRPGQRRHAKPAFTAIERLWHDYRESPAADQQPSLKRDLGIDGDWLLRHFGDEFRLSPGPLIGKVLDKLEETYANGGPKTEKAYQAEARRLLRRYSSKA